MSCDFLKILACEHFYNFCIDNIHEEEYFEVHSKFWQCPHDKEAHQHVFVSCDSCLHILILTIDLFILRTSVVVHEYLETANVCIAFAQKTVLTFTY